MKQGVIILLSGTNINETAKTLAVRLVELNCNAEYIDDAAAKSLGGSKAAAYACELLARNGVVVIVASQKMRPKSGTLPVTIDANDTPDFAAEKILDDLAQAGVVRLETTDYTPEDEERIRERLSQLGYIE